jgi:repressor LexA
MKMIAITKKQKIIIDFIKFYVDTYGYSPSFQEIADGIGLKSLATVHKHIGNLVKRGKLKMSPHSSRSIEIVEEVLMGPRFSFWTPERLWDNVDNVFWVREK